MVLISWVILNQSSDFATFRYCCGRYFANTDLDAYELPQVPMKILVPMRIWLIPAFLVDVNASFHEISDKRGRKDEYCICTASCSAEMPCPTEKQGSLPTQVSRALSTQASNIWALACTAGLDPTNSETWQCVPRAGRAAHADIFLEAASTALWFLALQSGVSPWEELDAAGHFGKSNSSSCHWYEIKLTFSPLLIEEYDKMYANG